MPTYFALLKTSKSILSFAYFVSLIVKIISLYFAYFVLLLVGKISLYFALLCLSNYKENTKTNSTDLSILRLLCPYFAYFVPTLPTMYFTHTLILVLEKGKKKLYMGRIFISLSQTGRQKVSYNFWAKFDYSDHICIAQHIAAVGNNLKSRFCFDGEGI